MNLIKTLHKSCDVILNLLISDEITTILKLTSQDNGFYSQRIDLAKVKPEKPLSDDEMLEKFISLALYGGVSYKEASIILSSVFKIETELEHLFKKLK